MLHMCIKNQNQVQIVRYGVAQIFFAISGHFLPGKPKL